MKTLEEVKALVATAVNEDIGGRERLAAFEEADACRKQLKVGWSKLGLEVEQVTILKTELPALAALDENDETLGDASPGDAASSSSESSGDTTGQTDGASEPSSDPTATARAAKKVAKAKEDGVDSQRGGLTRLVESLLMDAGLSYLDIIHAVLKDFPKANTSARSIASVAAGMRRAGKNVPMRRPVAKPKEAKPAVAAEPVQQAA